MRMMMNRLAWSVLLALTVVSAQEAASPITSGGVSKPLQWASPLQTYTIFDKPVQKSARSPRSSFLPRFRTGLAAERRERARIVDAKRRSALDGDDDDDDDIYGSQWAEMSAAGEERERKKEERRVEAAFDRAVARYDNAVVSKAAEPEQDRNKYQFVGVVNPPSKSGNKVTWYARKKPAGSKWSVRLVHVNRDAVLRDLFTRGKVDVYGEYVNTGKMEDDGVSEEEGGGAAPVVEGRYTVRERTWRTLWNFTPRRLFTDSSGMFWRERRIAPGIYTDGRKVYETVYRYRDGKNGMKPITTLPIFINSPSVDKELKSQITKKLAEESPDIVVEK